MTIQPRIEQLEEKTLIGKRLQMSILHNRTGELWGSFAPIIKEITNRVSTDKISMQVYDVNYYKEFSPTRIFEKWATVEVNDLDTIPNGMESFVLESGQYAVFDYKGSSNDTSIYEYIFREWLPKSPYTIDNRPHFEVLGDKYQNNSPNSEEEIWIPIREN